MIKKCNQYQETKSLEDFYPHKKMSDGRLSFCKDCIKHRVNERRRLNIDKYLQMERARSKERHKDPKFIESRREYLRRYPKEKRKANHAVSNAIRDGKMVRGICFCGKIGQAHHHDYSKPLDVIWLCPKHHSEAHKC